MRGREGRRQWTGLVRTVTLQTDRATCSALCFFLVSVAVSHLSARCKCPSYKAPYSILPLPFPSPFTPPIASEPFPTLLRLLPLPRAPNPPLAPSPQPNTLHIRICAVVEPTHAIPSHNTI